MSVIKDLTSPPTVPNPPGGTPPAPAPNNCELDGVQVLHGSSRAFYDQRENENCTSRRQNRTCNNGELSGNVTYRFSSCSAPEPPPQTPVQDRVTKGNLILRSYDSGSNLVRFGEGESHFLVLQEDGNLVLYRSNGQPVWASNTGLQSGQNKYCEHGCFFAFQGDGNLVLYSHTDSSRSGSRPYWATNTSGSNAAEVMVFNIESERLELLRANDSKIKDLDGTKVY
jgi:hypothetical protein